MYSSCCNIFHVDIAYNLREAYTTQGKQNIKKKLVYNHTKIYVLVQYFDLLIVININDNYFKLSEADEDFCK